MPPPELRFRVAGTEDEEWFDRSGRMTVDSFQAALRNLGRDLTEFSDIYDFGAGCGRALRHLIERVPRARVAASDSDGLAVEWLQRNWPTVDVRLNGGLPPLNFETGRFDLVLAFSVFTHLDEAYQDAWLAELQRVTRPGAILLLTVHGPWNWRDHLEKIPELAQHQQTLDQHGFLFYTGDQWSQYFADYYHTSFHQPWYIRDRWSKWFDVVDIAQSAAQPPQDLVVLRRA